MFRLRMLTVKNSRKRLAVDFPAPTTKAGSWIPGQVFPTIANSLVRALYVALFPPAADRAGELSLTVCRAALNL